MKSGKKRLSLEPYRYRVVLMEQRFNIQVTQGQRLVMTQSLRQSIEMLQLSTVQLSELINTELMENPVLDDEPGDETVNDKVLEREMEESLLGDDSTDMKRENDEYLFGNSSDSGMVSSHADEDSRRAIIERATAKEESLYEHLLWQARMSAASKEEYRLFEGIITSLDRHGQLPVKAEELAASMEVPFTDIERVRSLLQGFDPLGCGSYTVHETLLFQARHHFPDETRLHEIIEFHFEDMEHLRYERIAAACLCDASEIIAAGKLLQHLDPWPGLQYGQAESRYIIPDMEVRLVDDEVILVHNDEWLPRLSLNRYYLELGRKKDIEKKQHEYIQDRIQRARMLIRNIMTRRETIHKVVSAVMKAQKDFLRHGPGYLRNLTHLEVAEQTGYHESTVSRVTSNKHVQTSWGVYDLKSFFVSGIADESGVTHSSDQVMARIRSCIANEDPEKPLSDDSIVAVLGKEGIEVARRTVAKYRGRMEIPPAHMRKKLHKMRTEE